jgi:hypothetical protein
MATGNGEREPAWALAARESLGRYRPAPQPEAHQPILVWLSGPGLLHLLASLSEGAQRVVARMRAASKALRGEAA